MSDSEDQPTQQSANRTVWLGPRANPRFPPSPSVPYSSFPFGICSVGIPLSDYQLSTEFQDFSLTTASPTFLFVSDAVKIMKQQRFRTPSPIILMNMPESNNAENLPGTSSSGTSGTSSTLSQLETEDMADAALPLFSRAKKRERLVNKVGPMPNNFPPSLPPDEEEVRLDRPHPRRVPIRQNPSPRIQIRRIRVADYATVPVEFAVEVMDVPPQFEVTSTMIDAIVQSPSRNVITCTIRTEFETIRSGRVKVFRGSFETTQETGGYKLQVRLVLPLTEYQIWYGVMGDESTIIVLKNYVRDGERFQGSGFQLPFKEQQGRAREMSVENGLDAAGGRAVLKAWGLACDKLTNRLYYSDCMGNQVNCVDPTDGRVLFEFRGHSGFNHPMGIDVDEVNRRVMVCDKDNHRICIFTVDGQFVRSVGGFGYDDGMFNYPWDVAVNPSGDRFAVTDTENKRVQLFDQFGNFVNIFSIFEFNPFLARNLFYCPRSILFSNSGKHVFVTDFVTKNVVQIPMHFRSYHRVAPECEFLQLQGIAIDEFNALLVPDSQHNCICLVTLGGKLLGQIRNIGENNLQKPVNVVIMAAGRIAILDSEGKLFII